MSPDSRTPSSAGADRPAIEPRTAATAKRWATLNIPNPYRPDTVAWVAFESGQLAALDAIEAEAAQVGPPPLSAEKATRTIRAEWDCDGTECKCHDPMICADCGCLHNEADEYARLEADR